MSNAALRQNSGDDLILDISQTVSKITGVQLGERQRVMVQTRVKKRISDLGLNDIEEYADHFRTHRKEEIDALVSLLTTHHTYFFREAMHFSYLTDKALPELVAAARKRGDKTIRILCAACSKGHEVYTVSMLMSFHLPKIAPEMSYEILGLDVDPESVEYAKNGVYKYQELKSAPANYMQGNWVRGTGEISEYVKAAKSIRNPCKFEVANLMELANKQFSKKFDVIFCRNVFIYFTNEQIKKISGELMKQLNPEGVFFIGISESLNGMNLPIETRGPSIYTHVREKTAAVAASKVSPIAAPVVTRSEPVKEMAQPLRVFCIDDSISILALLKKILVKEHGFEVVGTANNGIEAAQKLKTITADVVTLDIHMPEQDGPTYLKTQFNSKHPPVVMISSVNREDSDLALRCLDAGASDYVEKPSLANMNEVGDEIRMKLKSAFRNKGLTARDFSIDKSFATPAAIKQPDKCLRLVVARMSDKTKLKHLFGQFHLTQPATVILVEGSANGIPTFVTSLGKELGKPVDAYEPTTELVNGKIYVADFATYDALLKRYSDRSASIVAYGEVSDTAANKLLRWSQKHVLVEDLGKGGVGLLTKHAADVVPHTSFAFMSQAYLSR